MPVIASASLVNGGRVVLSTTAPTASGSYNLVAELYGADGGLIRAITVDSAFSSDGSTSPPRAESFANYQLVPLSGGGFAVAYDDMTFLAPGSSSFAEVRLYDAAGQLMGQSAINSQPPGGPGTVPGHPELWPTATNGVAMVVRGGDFINYLTVYDSTGSIRIQQAIAERPSHIYDSYDGLALTTYRMNAGDGAAGLAREIFAVNGVREMARIVQSSGTEGGESLVGTAGPDDIYGLGGADTLEGGAGFDRLFGGAGGDHFRLGVDGSVDFVADFRPGEDVLSLTPAGGGALPATGVLTFWRANGVLTWDADGDAGPGAAVSVAVLSGVPTLTAADFAPGFEPAVVRIYNPIDPANAGLGPGSRSDIVFGYGKQPFVMASADYNLAGQLLTYGVNWADGTASMKWFDTFGGEAWDSLVADYDAQGRVEIYATYWDDGTHVLWLFDPDNSEPWSRIVDHYDAQGRLLTHEVVLDNGAQWGATYDVADVHPWAYMVEDFGLGYQLVGRTFYNADGSIFG